MPCIQLTDSSSNTRRLPLSRVQGSTAQFGKKSQAGFLFQFKVPKMEEYCMYFPFSELRKWSKKTAETRRRNCAVLPYYRGRLNRPLVTFQQAGRKGSRAAVRRSSCP